MSAFRDEREAMLERLHQLEEELAGVRDTGKREELLRELSTLANRVEVATRRVAEDERALGEIAESITRMRSSIGGAPADEPLSRPREALASSEPSRPPATRAPYIISGVILAIGVVGAFAMGAGKRRAAIDLTAPASSIPGFPHAVDPSALLAPAREMSGRGKDARITAVRVDYVGSNGRVDLRGQGYEGRIAFSFTGPRPPPPPESSGPLGAPRPAQPVTTVATVTVTSTGMHTEPFNFGMGDEGLADPTCTIEQVWTAARNAGAPPEAIAVITYGSKNVFASGHFHSETRWHFEIHGTKFAYDIADPGCQVATNDGFKL